MNNKIELNKALTDPLQDNVWQSLKNAIRGTEADYTQIPLNKAVFLLAVPMVLELMMESTFAVVDIFFVAKLGTSAVASVGLTETYLFLLYSIAMGFSMSVTAIIARRVGEQKTKEVGISAMQAILIGLLASLPFTIGGIFFAKELLSLMGADAWTLDYGYKYTQWMLGGNAIIMLLFIINAIYRGAGDAAIAMRVLIVANVLNMVLDPILIFGFGPIPAMGIEGAAIATNIGRGIAVVMQLWILFRGGKHIKVLLSHIRFQGKLFLEILRTSIGGIAQMFIAMSSWIFLMRILADISSEAVAGATIAMRVMMFSMMPAWGMANAAATLVGQNLGAEQPDRAESSVWKVGTYNMIFMICVAVIFFFNHDALIAIFSNDALVISIGGKWLQIVSYSFFVYGWWMVATQAFNGAGDTITPTIINLIFFWILQIPLAWFLALQLNWGHSGVFWAIFFTETTMGLFTIWLFSKGKWKLHKI